jgi:uncharacterized UBP type Zn finger protein
MCISFGFEAHLVRRALKGTNNGSMDAVLEYMDAHAQDPEFNKPEPVEELPSATEQADADNKRKRKKARVIPIEIQRLFTQLQLINQYAISTNGTLPKLQ